VLYQFLICRIGFGIKTKLVLNSPGGYSASLGSIWYSTNKKLTEHFFLSTVFWSGSKIVWPPQAGAIFKFVSIITQWGQSFSEVVFDTLFYKTSHVCKYRCMKLFVPKLLKPIVFLYIECEFCWKKGDI
jgi:hypothetical protein